MFVLSWVKGFSIGLKSQSFTTMPSFAGKATSGNDITKQSVHAVSKTDMDDHGNNNRANQYNCNATLLHEWTSGDTSWIELMLSKFQSSLHSTFRSRKTDFVNFWDLDVF